MTTIEFEHLDSLLAFLQHCRREGIGDSSSQEDHWIHVEVGPRYTMVFERSWRDEHRDGELFGGKIGSTRPPSAHLVHINELLLQLAVLPKAEARGHVPSMVLVARSDEAKSGEHGELVELLLKHWNTIPKHPDAPSEFRYARNEDGKVWFTVEIPEIERGFDYSLFRRKLQDSRLKVFLPAWRPGEIEECFLYVEDGFHYPRPAEFAWLYEYGARVERENDETDAYDFRHVVLLESRGATSGGRKGLNPTQAYLLGAPEESQPDERYCDFSRSHEIYSFSNVWAESGEEIGNISSFDASPLGEGANLSREVELIPLSSKIGLIHDIEGQIGIHQRKVEELQAKRAGLHQFSNDEHLAIYIFRKEEGLDDLPNGLLHFLERPLGELSQYSYIRTEADTGEFVDHWVVAHVRAPLSSILAVSCSECYLCEGRWLDAGLTMFVKHGYRLSIDLNEVGLVSRFQSMLETVSGLEGFDECNLIVGPNEKSPGGISYRMFERAHPELLPLSEAFSFINGEGGGIEPMAIVAGTQIEVNLERHRVELQSGLLEFEGELVGHAESVVDESEKQWEKTRTKAQSLQLKSRVADVAVKVSKEVYREMPESWLDFLDKAWKADEEISQMKVKALGRWFSSADEREDRLERLKILNIDSGAEIKAKEKSLGESLLSLKERRNELAQDLVELQKLEMEVAEEQAKCSKLDEKLKPQRKLLEVHLKSLSDSRVKLEKEFGENEELKERYCIALQEYESLQEKSGEIQEAVNHLSSDWGEANREAAEYLSKVGAAEDALTKERQRTGEMARRWLEQISEGQGGVESRAFSALRKEFYQLFPGLNLHPEVPVAESTKSNRRFGRREDIL